MKANKSRVLDGLVTVALCIAFITPRLLSVGTFVTIDEHEWLASALNFQNALVRRDFPATYRWEHPGVTTMWVAVLGHLWRCPGCGDGVNVASQNYEAYVETHGARAIEILASSRMIMVLVNTGILILAYRLMRDLSSWATATFGFALIALDSFFTAHTQLLHLDGLLSSLILLALLAFAHYLHTQRQASLALSGIAVGLSWLTKSPGLFIIPVVIIIAAIDLLKPGLCRAAIARRVGSLAVWGGAAAIVFVVLWPAMWVTPVETLSKMFQAALAYAQHGHESPVFFGGQIYPDGRLGAVFYPISYVWRSSPVVLVGLIAALCWHLRRRDENYTTGSLVELALLTFVVLYSAQLSLSYKKFDRYLLPIYPCLMLVAASGWRHTLTWLAGLRAAERRGISRRFMRRCRSLVALILVLLHGLGLYQSFPYYLSYFNPLLGGTRQAVNVLTLGWGEGLDQAAAYLNAKPDAEKLRVASWYRPCFSYFFAGETWNIDNVADMSLDHTTYLLSADYMVIYVHQLQRQIPRSLVQRITQQTPEHVVYVGNVPYVFIYRLE